MGSSSVSKVDVMAYAIVNAMVDAMVVAMVEEPRQPEMAGPNAAAAPIIR